MDQYIQELPGFGLEGKTFSRILGGGWGWFGHSCLLHGIKCAPFIPEHQQLHGTFQDKGCLKSWVYDTRMTLQ
jgi:hypothetical protein